MNKQLVWCGAVALLAATFGFAGDGCYGANGTAQLGTDPRLNGSTLRQQAGVTLNNFGFAFMTNVTRDQGPQLDTCQTISRPGSNATLTATEGVASPENPEQVFCTLNGDTATFFGRTSDCYYMVSGTYGGGGGGGSAGGGSAGGGVAKWNADFDTNNDENSPHFVVYINQRYRSDDDIFIAGQISHVCIELHNYDNGQGTVDFKLRQTILSGNGAVTFLKADGTPADSEQVYHIQPGVTQSVDATAADDGIVSIWAEQQP